MKKGFSLFYKKVSDLIALSKYPTVITGSCMPMKLLDLIYESMPNIMFNDYLADIDLASLMAMFLMF